MSTVTIAQIRAWFEQAAGRLRPAEMLVPVAPDALSWDDDVRGDLLLKSGSESSAERGERAEMSLLRNALYARAS